MALLLALWRWLMPPAAGFGVRLLPAQPPQVAVLPAAVREAFRLAPILAPPPRLLT